MVGLQRAKVRRGDVDKLGAGVAKERVLPACTAGDGSVDVEVESAVVIEVGEGAGVVARIDGDMPGRAAILEPALAPIAEEAQRAVVGGKQIELSVGVDIGRAHAHGAVTGELRLTPAPRHTGSLRDIRKPPVVIPEQAVGIAIHVGHGGIEVAVFVVVEPHGADGAAGVGQPDRRGDVGELAAVVAIERIGAIAEGDEKIEIAVAVEIHEHRLPNRAGGDNQPRGRRHVRECRTVVAVQLQHRCVLERCEPEQQVRIAVGINIRPRRRPRRPRVGHAGRRCDVREHALVVAIQPIGFAVEADEHVEVAVAVDISERVGEVRSGGEHLWLNRLEDGSRRLCKREAAAKNYQCQAYEHVRHRMPSTNP